MGVGVPVMFRDRGQEMGMGVPVSVCLLVLTCSIIECFLPWLAGTRTNTAGQNTPCKSTSFNIISIRFISCAVQCNQCGICIFFFRQWFQNIFGLVVSMLWYNLSSQSVCARCIGQSYCKSGGTMLYSQWRNKLWKPLIKEKNKQKQNRNRRSKE